MDKPKYVMKPEKKGKCLTTQNWRDLEDMTVTTIWVVKCKLLTIAYCGFYVGKMAPAFLAM